LGGGKEHNRRIQHKVHGRRTRAGVMRTNKKSEVAKNKKRKREKETDERTTRGRPKGWKERQERKFPSTHFSS